MAQHFVRLSPINRQWLKEAINKHPHAGNGDKPMSQSAALSRAVTLIAFLPTPAMRALLANAPLYTGFGDLSRYDNCGVSTRTEELWAALVAAAIANRKAQESRGYKAAGNDLGVNLTINQFVWALQEHEHGKKLARAMFTSGAGSAWETLIQTLLTRTSPPSQRVLREQHEEVPTNGSVTRVALVNGRLVLKS